MVIERMNGDNLFDGDVGVLVKTPSFPYIAVFRVMGR